MKETTKWCAFFSMCAGIAVTAPFGILQFAEHKGATCRSLIRSHTTPFLDAIVNLSRSNFTFNFETHFPEPLPPTIPMTGSLDPAVGDELSRIVKEVANFVETVGSDLCYYGSVGGGILILVAILLVLNLLATGKLARNTQRHVEFEEITNEGEGLVLGRRER